MYCKQCGSQSSNDAKFCENCGATFNGASTTQVPNVPQKQNICCPKCGNRNLQVTTDRDWGSAAIGGVVGTAVGGLGSGMINAASNLKQQTFFVCPDCSHRFRSPQELEEEAQIYGKRSKVISIVCVLMLALCTLLLIIGIKFGVVFINVFSVICAALFVLCMVFMNAKANKPKKALQEITEGMRRFL